jgi:hypothetical protein
MNRLIHLTKRQSHQKILLAVLSIIYLTTPSYGQVFKHAFSIGDSQPKNSVLPEKMTIDPAGNTYLAGTFNLGVQLDPSGNTPALSAKGTNDLFIGKYTPSGEYVWGFNLGSTGTTIHAKSIASDGNGNIYITGVTTGSIDFDPGEGNAIKAPSSALGIFVAKYDSSGAYQWTFLLNPESFNSSTLDIATDSSGNVYLTGGFKGSCNFNPLDIPANAIWRGSSINRMVLVDDVVFVAKYNSNGICQWANRLRAFTPAFPAELPGAIAPTGIAVDAEGNVYATGGYTGSRINLDSAGSTSFINSRPTIADTYIVKYNSSGAYQWGKVYDAERTVDITNIVQSIFSDATGSVYVIGYTGTNIFFAKRQGSNGNTVWQNTINSVPLPNINYRAGIYADAYGNVYISGNFTGINVDFDPSPATANLSLTSGGYGSYVAKYRPNGSYLWARSILGEGSIGALSVAVNFDQASGNIYTSGIFAGNGVNFSPSGSFLLNSGGDFSAYLAIWGNDTCVWNGASWQNCSPETGSDPVKIAGNSSVPSFTAESVEIAPGFHMDMTPGAVARVHGDFVNKGQGTLPNNWTVSFEGELSSHIINEGSSNLVLPNMTVNKNNGQVILNDSLWITKVLTPQAGGLITNDILTLKADNIVTFGQVAPGNGSIVGNVTVEKKLLDTVAGWRHLCLPVQSSLGQLKGISLSTLENSRPREHNIFTWDAAQPIGSSGDTAGGWRTASGSDGNAHGYVLYSNQGNGIHLISEDSTISIKGTLSQSDYTIPLHYTRDPASNPHDSVTGWNYIPNRFASCLMIPDIRNDADFTSGYKGIHLWYHAYQQYIGLNGSSSIVQYNTFPGSVDAGSNVIVNPWQGMWVKATGNGQSITIKNSHRRTSSGNFSFSAKRDPDFIVLTVSDKQGRKDFFSVSFDYDGSNDFRGDLDVLKIKTSNQQYPSLYSRKGSQNLSESVLPYSDEKSIPLVFESFMDGASYTLAPFLEKLSWSGSVLLEDKKTGSITDLRTNPEYTFTHDASFASERFLLHFNGSASSVVKSQADQSSFYIYHQNENLVIKWSESVNALIEAYDISGKKLYSGRAENSDSHIIPDGQTSKGVLLVRITTATGTVTQKVIK